MFIIITWNDPTDVYVAGDYYFDEDGDAECHAIVEMPKLLTHQEAQDFIYNSDNDRYLLSNTKIVELN